MRKLIALTIFLFFYLFGFPQNSLSDYLQTAIKNSPVFIDNQNQVNSLAYDSMLIRAALKLQVNFTSNNMYAPVINGYGFDAIITNGGNYNALLAANYTLISKNYLNNKFSALTIQKQNLELSTKLNERDLRQTVTSQYITVYGEQQILATTQKVLEIMKEENVILKSITENGVSNQTDYLSFLVNFKQQQILFAQQQLQIQTDLYVLNYLCGISDTTYNALQEPFVKPSQNISTEQTTPYQQFILDSLKIQNSFEQLKFNYKPKINLLANAGYNTTFIYQAQNNFGASVGLNLTIPIYDGKQHKLQISKLRLLENTRIGYADFYKRQYTIKQMQLLQQISETENIIGEAREQTTISETLLKANNKLLQTGDTRITDYLLSLTNYISSQSTLQQLRTSKMQLINQYNYLNY